MSSQDNSESINLTLNHINKLLIGVNVAQSRGAYTFDDSAELAETVKLVTKFIKHNSEQTEKNAKEQAQAQPQSLQSQQAQAQLQQKLQQPQLSTNLQNLQPL